MQKFIQTLILKQKVKKVWVLFFNQEMMYRQPRNDVSLSEHTSSKKKKVDNKKAEGHA